MGKLRIPCPHPFVMVGLVVCCLQLAVAQHPASVVSGASPQRSKHTKSVMNILIRSRVKLSPCTIRS